MSIQYKYTPSKNHRARIVTREVAGVVETTTTNREDNAIISLVSTPTGQSELYIRVPRANGTGLDQVVLNGRQLRTLARVFDRHNNG